MGENTGKIVTVTIAPDVVGLVANACVIVESHVVVGGGDIVDAYVVADGDDAGTHAACEEQIVARIDCGVAETDQWIGTS